MCEGGPEDSGLEAEIAAGNIVALLQRHENYYRSPGYEAIMDAGPQIHNSGQRNVLADLVASGDNSLNPFLYGQAFWDLITRLEISAAEMIEASRTAVSLGRLDPDSLFLPEQDLNRWFDLDQSRARDMVAEARRSSDGDIYALQGALRRGAEFAPDEFLDAAIALSTSENARHRHLAVWSISEMKLDRPDLMERALHHLELVVAGAPGRDRANALHVLSQVLLRDLPANGDRLLAGLRAVRTLHPDSDWQDLYIDVLWRQNQKLSGELIDFLLDNIGSTGLQAGEKLLRLENAFYGLMNGEHWAKVVQFLERIFTGPEPLDFDRFRNLKFAFHSSPHFAEICCRWFANGAPELCAAARYLLGERQVAEEALEIGADVTVAMSSLDRVRLARRAIAYLIHAPVLAASFAVAALRACEDDAGKQIGTDLLDPLLYCYAGGVRQYLQGAVEREPGLGQWITPALEAQQQFNSGLSRFELLDELAPSEVQRVIAADVRREEQAEIFAATRAKMPLLSIIHQSKILFGDATISYVPKAPGTDELTRSVMEMRSFGYEGEIPRLSAWDQIGLHIELFRMRTEPKAR